MQSIYSIGYVVSLKYIHINIYNILEINCFYWTSSGTAPTARPKSGTEVHLILDEKIYNRLKNDFEEEYNVLLENNVSLYIYSDKIRPSSFMATDNFLLLKLFEKDGEFDHRKIISFTPSALEWGNELAQYYIDRPTKI